MKRVKRKIFEKMLRAIPDSARHFRNINFLPEIKFGLLDHFFLNHEEIANTTIAVINTLASATGNM